MLTLSNYLRLRTLREQARIQGFPDIYKFCGTLGEMHRQVGNAVPPPLGKALGAQIRAAVAGEPEVMDSAIPRDGKIGMLLGNNKEVGSDKRRIDDIFKQQKKVRSK